jgi:hypothetical protein
MSFDNFKSIDGELKSLANKILFLEEDILVQCETELSRIQTLLKPGRIMTYRDACVLDVDARKLQKHIPDIRFGLGMTEMDQFWRRYIECEFRVYDAVQEISALKDRLFPMEVFSMDSFYG